MPEGETTEMLTALRETSEQRDGFRAHAETLAQEVLKLKEQAEGYAGRLAATERSNMEARSQWAATLEQAQRDFSADMLTRDDLEAMRLQLIEQTEAPWRAKAKALESEVAQARDAAAGHRRDAERARAALDSASHEHRAVVREVEVRHETAEAELRAKVALLESAPAPGGDEGAERTRRLQREHAETSVRNQKLLDEVDELRRENDGLLGLRSELLSNHAAQQGEAKAQQRLFEAEKASLDRRISHLQHELDSSAAAQERMHEASLHTETEMRGLRASVDDAQHAVASEKAASAVRLSEVQRELSQLKLEMERRQTEAVRREGLLQKSRDELASTAAQSEREASSLIASARDEEASRVRRLESERQRLNEQLVSLQSEAAATAAAVRDRADALQGEVAALKAELHGASLEKRSAHEEAARLRRRTEEAEQRLEAAIAEMHQARMEATEYTANRSKLTEVEAQATVAQEKLQLQLSYTQKEADKMAAQSTGEITALTSKVKQVKRLAAKERAGYQQAEAVRIRQIEALKREVNRLRADRNELKRAGADTPLAARTPPGAMREDVRGMVAASVAAEGALAKEAAALKAQVAGVAGR